MTNVSARTPARIQWSWKSNYEPWASGTAEEWSSFSDVETAIIEEAYQNKLPKAIIDDYHIDFKNSVQISNQDESKQRPVKRVDTCASASGVRLRETRFMPNPINPSALSTQAESLLGFPSAFLEHFDIFDDSSLEKPANLRMVIEKAAEGIISEGKMAGKQKEAEWMAKQLLSTKEGTNEEIWRCCAHLYTMESFLYKKMNEFMRLQTEKQHKALWKSKVATFGPFAYLLSVLKRNTNNNKMTVYRGATLSNGLIRQYRQSVGVYLNFTAFTSTSRNREKAEHFGNTLFVIDSTAFDGADVSSYSDYPDEEETLLSFDSTFYIRSCTFNANQNKWIIHLSKSQND